MSETKIDKKTSKKDSKDDSKTPNWMDGIKLESIENALKVGLIYPKFKAYKNTVYEIYLLSEPKYVDNEKGQFFTIDISRDDMKYSLNMNESFKFQLATFLKRNKCKLQDLITRGVPLRIQQDNNGFWTIQKL